MSRVSSVNVERTLLSVAVAVAVEVAVAVAVEVAVAVVIDFAVAVVVAVALAVDSDPKPLPAASTAPIQAPCDLPSVSAAVPSAPRSPATRPFPVRTGA